MESSQPPFPTSGDPGKEPVDGGGANSTDNPSQPASPGEQNAPQTAEQQWPPPGQPAPEQPQPYPQYGYPQTAAQPQQAWQQQAYQQQAQQQQPGQPYGQPAPGQQPPYGYYQPHAYTYAGGYYYGQPPGPGNDIAVASVVTAGCAIGALIFTAGIVAPLSLIASIVAIVLAVKGKKAVDSGKTRMHRDVARAGFWVGIAGIVLSVIAIAIWVAVIVIGINVDQTPADPGDLATLLDLLPL